MADNYLVGINGLFLDHPRTGTGVYTREVLARLAGRRDGLRYLVFGHPEHAAACADGDGVTYQSMQAPLRRAANVEKLLWEQMALPRAAAQRRVDLLYAPYFSLPLWTRARTVATVHDVIPLMLPEYAPSSQLRAYFRLVSAATRRAHAVVTDSRHAAGDIARVLRIPEQRIHVVYLGVDARYGQPIEPERVQALRDRLGLPERFTLYLGGNDPRKNIAVLLQARRLLLDRCRALAPLALVAGSGNAPLPARWARCDPHALAARLGLGGDVLFLDRVTDEDKPALYAAAMAFAFPSRYEGFGLPPLEAMASGTPVLCSTSSSLPEVTGDAAIQLDPNDAAAWADAFERIDADEALRRQLAARGRARAAGFTWDRTAAGLEHVFQHVLAS